MAIDKATLKEMVGKRITIDGVKHRVEKVVATKGLIVTRDGTEALAEGVYKKGPGFFYDSPKGTKKKAPAAKPAAKEEPVKETARARRAREKAEAEAPEETAREKRARLKREKAEAEAEAAKPARARKTPGAKGDGKAVPSKKKKLFEAFEQNIAERISQESFDLLAEAYGERGDYAITPVAVGAAFDNDALKITITVMSANKTTKEIKNYIRDHREATDVASDDEEDDDLDDDDLEDDDADDSLEDDEDDDDLEDGEEEDDDAEDQAEENLLAELNDLSRADLRKIAKIMDIDDYKDFSKEDLAQELSEYEEDDVREAAAEAGVELSDDEESDDEDDDSEDDEEDDEDEPAESATVEDLVAEVLEAAPGLKEASVTKFIEAFLASDEIADKFDGELVPGRTQLQEKGNKGPEMLLLGYDAANEVIKLVNLSTGKTRSKTISEVVHMEILEAADDAE